MFPQLHTLFLETRLNGSQHSDGSSEKVEASDLLSPSIPSRTFHAEDEDNPFVEKPETKDEDPTGPICLVCSISSKVLLQHSTMNQQSPPQVLQNLFTAKKLPYGAQYEINRLVSVGKLTYGNILIEDVNKLAKMGTNREAAPATAKLMLKRSFEDDESDSMSISFSITN